MQETIGKRIKRLREAASLSQWRLSADIGVPQSTLWRWETQDATPGATKLPAIADALGVTTDYLLGRTDDEGAA